MKTTHPLLGLAYKEWLKLRYVVWLPFIAALIVLFFAYSEMLGLRTGHGSIAIWRMIVFKEEIPFKHLSYIPFISGILIAAAQWLPETLNKKIRLFFHIPVNPYKSLFLTQAIGVTVLLVIACILSFGMYFVTSLFLPIEVARLILLTILPWCIAGFIAYAVTAMFLIETHSLRRALYLLVGGVFIYALFKSETYGSYTNALPYFALIAFAFLVAMFSVLDRIKRGNA